MDLSTTDTISRFPEPLRLFDWEDLSVKHNRRIHDSMMEGYSNTPLRSHTVHIVSDAERRHQRRHRHPHSAPALISSSPVLEALEAVRISHEGNHPSSSYHEVDDQYLETTKLERELENVRLELELQVLKNEKLEEEKQEILERWSEAAEEIHKRENGRNHNHDDRFFESEWGTLNYNIKNCAQSHFGEKLKLGTFSRIKGPPTEAFKGLTAEFAEYLMSDYHRPLLMQALIWHYLCEEVFATRKPVSNNKWAEPEGTLYQSLAETLRPATYMICSKEVTDYHRWRVNTASLIQTLPKAREKKAEFVGKLSEKMADTMKPWNTGYPTHLKEHLKQIVARAIDLDAEMQKQTAYYHVKTWKLGLNMDNGRERVPINFDNSTMEVLGVDPFSRKLYMPVSLVIRPALIKIGNADGEKYDISTTIAKANVLEKGGFLSMRSTSQASHNGRNELANGRGTKGAVKRSASAMNTHERKSENLKAVKSSAESKGSVRRPRWKF